MDRLVTRHGLFAVVAAASVTIGYLGFEAFRGRLDRELDCSPPIGTDRPGNDILQSLPPIPPELGRISGEILLSGDEVWCKARDRRASWKTAVFLEHVPEDLWRTAMGPGDGPRHTECLADVRTPGGSDRLGKYAFDPPMLFCRPGDSFSLAIKAPASDTPWGLLPPDEFLKRSNQVSAMCIAVRQPIFYRVESFTENPWHFVLVNDDARFQHPLEMATGGPTILTEGTGSHVYGSYPATVEGSGGIGEAWVGYGAGVYAIGVQNPYHTLVDPAAGGRFVFDRVPPGVYWIRTFDPSFQTVRHPVRVSPGRLSEVELVIEQDKGRGDQKESSQEIGSSLRDDIDAGRSPPAVVIDRGAIEGKILLPGEEASALARERPPVYKTAALIESVGEDTWDRPARFPRSRPLRLDLTQKYAGWPRIEDQAGWVYEPSLVVVLGFKDCLQIVEPLDYGTKSRIPMWIASVEADIFDPLGGRLFPLLEPSGERLCRGRIEAWAGTLERYNPFGGHPNRFTMMEQANELGAYYFPPLRVQGWGRVERIQRSYGFPASTREWIPGEDPGDQAPLHVIGAQNPYHTLVDLHGDGTFRLEGVPAGTHWLRTFDAHFQTVRMQVVVEPGRTSRVEIVLTPRPTE